MLSVRKAWPFFQRSHLCPARVKECLKCSQVGHFTNVCKTKVKEIPSLDHVYTICRVDECKEEEDEYVFAVAGEAPRRRWSR